MAQNRSTMIKWIISAVLMLVCIVIPEQGIYTYQVKWFLAITVFFLALAAFEIAPIFVIAMAMPILWICFGVAPASVVLGSWTGTMVLMVTSVMFLGTTLQESGLLRRIAYFLMCKAKGNYMVTLLTIMLVGVLINILTMGNAYIIVPPLALGLYKSLDETDKNLGAGLAAAVMLGCCTSHSYTYFAGAWAVISVLGAEYMSAAITPLSITLHCWPLFVVSLLILFITSKMFKPAKPLGDVTYFEEQLAAMGKMTKREKSNGLVMILLVGYAFTSGLHGLDLNLGLAIIPWLVFLPFLDGADEITVTKMNWQMVFFLVACMSIGTVASSLGIGTIIADACKVLLQGSTSPAAVLLIVFAIVFVLNFLMTPLAIYSLITAPILMLVSQMGFDGRAFAYAINLCSEAIVMPYEYIPYLIVYAFGMISMKDFIKWNTLRSVIFFGGIFVVLMPYWSLIGLL